MYHNKGGSLCGKQQRIIIIGTSCSGKTTLAQQVSQQLAIKHVELDELH
jgi:adenylate kinase family enzyme